MKTKRTNSGSGFTIVEVMIVLAVTGLLFISVALLISGKQQIAEFQSAIHDAQAQIQQIINETAAGFYPNTSNFSCTAIGTSITIHPLGSNAQGTNAGCTFLGKALHFSDVSNGSSDLPNSEFAVYPIAGAQAATGEFHQADPTLVTLADSTNTLEYGLNVVAMYANGDKTHKIGSLAFAQSLGSASGGGSDTRFSGSQSLDLVVPLSGGSALGNKINSEAADLNSAFQHSQIPTATYADSADDIPGGTATSAEICFQSGGTNQSGLITVGNNSNGISLSLKLYSNQDCA